MLLASKDNHLIVGPGAIGSLVCHHIQNAVSVWAWQHRKALQLPTVLQTNHGTEPLSWQWLSNVDVPISLVWVCCKSTQVMHTVPAILELFPNATAILLHNGMGPQRELEVRFPGRVIAGTTTCGAYTLSGSTVQLTASGETKLGALTPPASPAQQRALHFCQQHSGVMNFTETPNIEAAVWQKLTINAVINPITAYYQIPNGQLLQAPYFEEASALANEIDALAQQLGYVNHTTLLARVVEIARLTELNRSSMHQDIAHQRSTEIETITGYLLTQATRLGLALPQTSLWHQRIVTLQQQYQGKP